MFYQYCPKINNLGTKYWAHAVSSDLVHWKNLGIAIAPTPGGVDKDGIWSGSAVIHDGVPTIVYTGASWSAESERAEREKGLVPERQMVAVAADPNDSDLLRWNKISENPVIAAPPPGMKVVGWRDPSLWKEKDTWLMVIGSGEIGVGGEALLYSSKDLRNWVYLHPLAVAKPARSASDPPRATFSSMWECPEFFFLSGKPVLLVARGNGYLTGTYSDHKFTQEIEGQIDYGNIAYAQKTMEDEKGRRIWWAWIREKRPLTAQSAAGWAGVMSLPKHLTMRDDGRLSVEPVSELKVLRGSRSMVVGQTIDQNSPILLHQVSGDCVEILATIDMGNAHHAGVRVRSTADGSEQTLIGFDRESSSLFCDTTNSSTDPELTPGEGFRAYRGVQKGTLDLAKGELLRLRIFVDASVLETFANGKASLSDRVYPVNPSSLGIGLFAKGGTALLKSMEIWQLKPISRNRLTSGAELFRV